MSVRIEDEHSGGSVEGPVRAPHPNTTRHGEGGPGS